MRRQQFLHFMKQYIGNGWQRDQNYHCIVLFLSLAWCWARSVRGIAKFLVSAYLRCAEVVQLIWESSSTGWRWSRSLSSGLQWCTDWPPRKPSNTKSSVPSVNGFRSSDLGSYWRRISQAYTETLCGISTTRQLSWASNLYVRFLCACRSSREQSASVVLLSMYLCLRVMFVIIFLWANNNKYSSAVAKRPRDVSCLSVVSFNSTKRRAQSFIVSYIGSMRTLKCCSVVFGVTLRFLVINISSSSPAINKLHRLLPTINVTTCYGPAAPCW